MRFYLEPREILFLDGLLQKVIVEETVPPAAYSVAGKIKRAIEDLAEAMPNEPLSP